MLHHWFSMTNESRTHPTPIWIGTRKHVQYLQLHGTKLRKFQQTVFCVRFRVFFLLRHHTAAFVKVGNFLWSLPQILAKFIQCKMEMFSCLFSGTVLHAMFPQILVFLCAWGHRTWQEYNEVYSLKFIKVLSPTCMWRVPVLLGFWLVCHAHSTPDKTSAGVQKLGCVEGWFPGPFYTVPSITFV